MVEAFKEDILLASAHKLFSRYGYKNVSIDKITKDAGVAKGTFYLYFKNKDELYKKMFDTMMDYHLSKMNAFSDENISINEFLFKELYFATIVLEECAILRNIAKNNVEYISESVNPDYFEGAFDKFAAHLIEKLPEGINQEKIIPLIHNLFGASAFLIGMKPSFETDDEYYDFIKNYAGIIVTGLLGDYEKNIFDISNVKKEKECLLNCRKVNFSKIKDFINKFI